MNKQTNTNKVNEPKTIKVSTVVKAVLVIIAITVSFIGGWNFRSADQARVQNEANALAQTHLKASK